MQEGGLSASPYPATIIRMNDKLLHESACVTVQK